MYKLKTVENMVLNVLISTPDARDDDMRLYYYVCRDCIRQGRRFRQFSRNSAARLLPAEEETKALSHTRTTP